MLTHGHPLCRIAGPEIRRWTNDIEQSLANPLHTGCAFCRRKCSSAGSAPKHWRNHQRQGSMKSGRQHPAQLHPHTCRRSCSTRGKLGLRLMPAADTATAGSLSAIILKCKFKKGGTGTKVTGYYSTLSLRSLGLGFGMYAALCGRPMRGDSEPIPTHTHVWAGLGCLEMAAGGRNVGPRST
jgi:hypothetical protein